MPYTRLGVAAVAGTIVDALFGFVVYGNMLSGQFAQHPDVYRPAADTSHMPFIFLGVFVAALAAAWMYAKGFDGGSAFGEGLRFGAVLGVFARGYAGIVNFAVIRMTPMLGASMSAAAFFEEVLPAAWTCLDCFLSVSVDLA